MEVLLAQGQDRPEPSLVARVADALRAGGVAVLPTDSVYGICCAAAPKNPAHERIFEVKRRDRAQTLPWFVADAADLDVYGECVPDWARRLAERFWPGALTAQPGADGPTIALRVPGSELDRAVVRALGRPVAQTSANVHGAPSATSGAGLDPAVAEAVDLVVDAGPAPVGVASTIVDATGAAPRVLREGALTEAEVLLAARG